MKAHRKTNESDPGQPKLLFVDDGSVLTSALTQTLSTAGLAAELVANPDDVLTDARGSRYDGVLINAELKQVDVLALCLELRVHGFPRVIGIIQDAPNDEDQLAAWRAGATDCIPRAVSGESLAKRLSAHVAGSRIRLPAAVYPLVAEVPTEAGVLAVSLVPTVVMVDGQELPLTRIEERLFARLWSARGAAVPSDELIASAWSDNKVAAATLQVHLHQLRRKLSKLGLSIERAGAAGYRFPLLARQGARNSHMARKSET